MAARVCAACGSADHPDNARFCFSCGGELAPPTCSSCGAGLVAAARFCSVCGSAQPGVPAVPAGHLSPVAERKVTSVLFCDLVGFTTISERHDQEEMRELLTRYFDRARQVVDRYGGTVEKFIGDAVMAVWGVPTAHEDDAERAVRAGLELVRVVEALDDVAAPDLALRVGIVTGEVAVTLGAEGQGMVAGDAVNTASRVQSVAEPGQVWVDETTRLLTTAAITYSEVGSHPLKGKAEPVPLWAARAVVAVVGGAQRADGLEAPLAGRDRELRLVKELFHATQETGSPALVVVAGEPGVGKTRLGWELEKYVDGLTSDTRWHSGRCLAYGEGVAFWAIAEAVRGRLGLVESDTDADPERALDQGLAAYVPDPEEAAWLRPRLEALLGLPTSGSHEREDLFSAWRTFFEHVCGDRPALVLTIDDAQDADEGTILFLEYLLATTTAPMFLMVMTRPGLLERWPMLATNRRSTVLHLQPLPPVEMAAMLDGLVSGLSTAVRDGLVSRAEGIPLFAVETIRSLIDRDLVVPRGGVYVLADPTLDMASIGAPASLQALVAARLDSLTPAQRRVVGDASVLGTTFSREAIGALAADVPDLDDVLASLARLEILATESSRLSAEYGSWHFVQAVVRQVAYGTLSRRDRKARHLTVVRYYENGGDTADDLAPMLAQHYLDALDASSDSDPDVDALLSRAVASLQRSAARARALGSPSEALRHLRAALARVSEPSAVATLQAAAASAALDSGLLDMARQLATAALDHWTAAGEMAAAGDVAATLARTLVSAGDANAARDLAMSHWQKLAQLPDTDRTRLELGRALGTVAVVLGQPMPEVALTSLRISEGLGDRLAICDSFIGLALSEAGRTPMFARVLLSAAAEIARESQRPALLARALANISAFDLPDNVGRCLERNEEARVAAHKSGVMSVVAHAVVNSGLALFLSGRWDETMTLLEQEIADPASETTRGALRDLIRSARREPLGPAAERADADDESELAWQAVRAGLRAHSAGGDVRAPTAPDLHGVIARLARVVGVGDDFVVLWPVAAQLVLDADDLETAEALLQVVGAIPAGLQALALRAHRRRFEALTGLARADATGVEESLRAAISGFEEWGSPVYRALAEADLARWLTSVGRPDEAAVVRLSAAETFEDLRARRWLTDLEVGASA